MNRREFLASAIASGSVLSLAVTFGFGGAGCGGRAARILHRADQTGELVPNMYVTIMPDGRVALAINKAEIGQGVTTAYSTLAAEELGVPLERIDFYLADSFPEYRTSFMMHQTGGSTSTKEGFVPIRQAAAAAREMLIGAAAADWGVPARECSVDDGFVVHVASGRKAGYGELTRKAAHQDVPDEPRLKKKGEFALIGKQGRRADGKRKVTGTAGFGVDVVVPDMVNAIVVHGPSYGARPTAIRADAARATRGVIDIFPIPSGVAVVADKHWQALAAARVLEIEWGKGVVAGLDTEKMRAAVAAYRDDGTALRDDGHAARAVSGARTKLDVVYEVPYLAHAPMEPQNCTVHVKGSHAEVWAPCQSPTVVQGFVADIIGGSRDDVLVHTTLSGGGFGRRLTPDVAGECARISQKVGRPVKLIWTREDDMRGAYYRPQTSIKMRGGVDDDGRVVAIDAHSIGQSISLDSGDTAKAAIPWIPHAVKDVVVSSLLAMVGTNSVPDFFSIEGLYDSPYRVPNFRAQFTPVRTKLPVTSWRSVGHSFTGFAAESFVDELARAARKDPVELRRAMLPESSKQRRVLDEVARRARWGSPAGKGIGRGIARHFCFDTEVAEVADVEIVDGRIRVRKVWAVIDCGIAVNPDIVRAQVEGAILFGLSAALGQEITLVDGVVQQGNYDTFPLVRMFEAPEIEVHVMDSDEAPTGCGEPGLPPIAPAVANAIFDASGVRLRRLPLQRAWDEHGGAS